MDKQGRDRALETAIAGIQKRFGEGAIAQNAGRLVRLGRVPRRQVDV